jgi:predicted nucleic acid-binding Zn ribbon protein
MAFWKKEKSMIYEYRCPEHGVIEMSHGMTESRDGRRCPECNSLLKPMISGGGGIILTGRPAWAYGDVKKSLEVSQNQSDGKIGPHTTITDKRDGSKYKGQKRYLNNNMGYYKAQW